MNESPVFTRTYEMILWLLPQAQKFPRGYRFNLAERVQRLALDFQAALVAAGKSQGEGRKRRLQEADLLLEQLRTFLRLCKDLHLLTVRQYEHAARLLVEVGKLLGAWLKQV